MPYLTPDSVPEERDCRALLIPLSSDWLAIFSGALTELAKSYNWEQQGITVDEALEVVNEVIAGYYEGCVSSGCELPDGGGIFRLNPETWEIEQLVNGEWVAPQGENALPPTPARTEPTADERRCLAAANAVNALALLYESLSDSYNEALNLENAINAFMAVLIGIVGTAFGLPVAALIAIFVVLMSVVYETIEFVTADLWDEAFTDKLECFFYECSSDDTEVVHFDIQCIINKIGAATEVDWNFVELRLLLQVSYILNMLGAQTIDAAGSTTEIASADCDDCENTWCYAVDLTDNDGGLTAELGTAGDWTSTVGWEASDVAAWFGADRTLLMLTLPFDTPVQLDTIDVHYDFTNATFNGATEGVGFYANDFANSLFSQAQNVTTEGTNLSQNVSSGIPQPADNLGFWFQPAYNTFGGVATMKIIQLTGHGDKPTFLEAMGWVEC